MNCLVTGGHGFIGLHLVRRLRELGHSVLVWDRAPLAGVEFEDVNVCDRSRVMHPWRSIKHIDTVFHLAAISRTAEALADPYMCDQVNVMGSVNLLDAIRDRIPQARVVFASSNIVYGTPNPYRASKLAMEEYLQAYIQVYGVNGIALRFSNVYGPGMPWKDPICLASMRRSAFERGYIELTGDGSQSRDFTHVHDIVERTIEEGKGGRMGVYDLSSGEHLSMFAAASYFGVPIQLIPARIGDTQEIKQGRSPRSAPPWIAFADGIRDVLAEVPLVVDYKLQELPA